ncbi:MAG: DUF2085 domain-containing protein [Chloroflexi bacterium CFX1]|nr:DUF2085 domain-containing protein [Chloroflexi bacterium CFX1]MCQ3952362.1 hypothetical protein [Chloroflexota bacterium]MDL1920414.1 DUF2085 domain-containing protein [Chloroflexi bacterium CFX5]NUQ58026.1 DUF2085 domain-containing protein [Anaerolineales bacterium]
MQTAAFTSKLVSFARWFTPLAALAAVIAWFVIAPAGALGKMDAIGYAVCHRIDARSLQINDRQLPLCVRCTGEFYTAGLALAFQAFVSGRKSKLPSRGILAVLFAFFVAFGVDGSNSYLYLLKQTGGGTGPLAQFPNLYTPNHILRLFTGSGMGIALAAMLYPVINQTLWKELDDRPALDWKKFGILTAGILFLNLLILTDSPLILYPIAYISALGTLSLLVLVFSLLWIILMKQDNTFEHPRQLWLAFASGLTLALLLILGIDLARLSFTGTWSGFPGLSG